MNEYDFILKFKLPDIEEDAEFYLAALESAGCDDALVGTGQVGHVVLDFTREAANAKDAVLSAINDVHTAIEGAELIEASPDFVGLTDVAVILDITRQAVYNVMRKHIETFPSPVHGGSSGVWHLSEVADFFLHHTERKFNAYTHNIAIVNRAVNVSRQYKMVQCPNANDEDCSSLLLPQEIKTILDETPLIIENNHAH